ncbi:hypothetical protein [Herpetosiphon geysericola]|uniref:Uncharacterized protein n=1 Tax=Herpetosiphon geysericola TaxID=70996 RepID=A0A0P6XLZ8_9CHLR|nr:hypothetical protein [Herpetosiphon geysericola]KPL80863.1 hypothetical protein SE18_23545 [Herpetosiphon geysericola]
MSLLVFVLMVGGVGWLLMRVLTTITTEQAQWSAWRIRVPAGMDASTLRDALVDGVGMGAAWLWLVPTAHGRQLLLHTTPATYALLMTTLRERIPLATLRPVTLTLPILRWRRGGADDQTMQGWALRNGVVQAVHATPQRWGWSLALVWVLGLLRPHPWVGDLPLDEAALLPDLPSLPMQLPAVAGVAWQFSADVALPLGTPLDLRGPAAQRWATVAQLVDQSIHAHASVLALVTPAHAATILPLLEPLGERLRVVDGRQPAVTTTLDVAAWLDDTAMTTLLGQMADLQPHDSLWQTIPTLLAHWRNRAHPSLSDLIALAGQVMNTPDRAAIDQRMAAQRWAVRLRRWLTLDWLSVFATPGDDLPLLLQRGGVVVVVLPDDAEQAALVQQIIAMALPSWQAASPRPLLTVSDIPWAEATLQGGDQLAPRVAWHGYLGGGVIPTTAVLKAHGLDPWMLVTMHGLLLAHAEVCVHVAAPWDAAPGMAAPEAPPSHVFWQCDPTDLFQPVMALPSTAAGEVESRGTPMPLASPPPLTARSLPPVAQLTHDAMLSDDQLHALIEALLADRRNGVSTKQAATVLGVDRGLAERLVALATERLASVLGTHSRHGLLLKREVTEAEVWALVGIDADDDACTEEVPEEEPVCMDA